MSVQEDANRGTLLLKKEKNVNTACYRDTTTKLLCKRFYKRNVIDRWCTKTTQQSWNLLCLTFWTGWSSHSYFLILCGMHEYMLKQMAVNHLF